MTGFALRRASREVAGACRRSRSLRAHRRPCTCAGRRIGRWARAPGSRCGHSRSSSLRAARSCSGLRAATAGSATSCTTGSPGRHLQAGYVDFPPVTGLHLRPRRRRLRNVADRLPALRRPRRSGRDRARSRGRAGARRRADGPDRGRSRRRLLAGAAGDERALPAGLVRRAALVPAAVPRPPAREAPVTAPLARDRPDGRCRRGDEVHDRRARGRPLRLLRDLPARRLRPPRARRRRRARRRDRRAEPRLGGAARLDQPSLVRSSRAERDQRDAPAVPAQPAARHRPRRRSVRRARRALALARPTASAARADRRRDDRRLLRPERQGLLRRAGRDSSRSRPARSTSSAGSNTAARGSAERRSRSRSPRSSPCRSSCRSCRYALPSTTA